MSLANYQELQAFSQFGSDLDENTKRILHHGDILMQILKQGQYKPKTLDEQVIALFLAKYDYLDPYTVKDAIAFSNKFYSYLKQNHPEVLDKINEVHDLKKPDRDLIRQYIKEYKEEREIDN